MSLENLYVDHAGIVGLKGFKISQFSPIIILLCYQISAIELKLCVLKKKMLHLVCNLKMSLSSLESPVVLIHLAPRLGVRVSHARSARASYALLLSLPSVALRFQSRP